MDNLAYVGGYGPTVPTASLKITAGKQRKMKRKPGTAVHALGKMLEKINKTIGVKNETLTKIRSDIAKEKAKFRSVMNKAATHVKKTEIKKGSTQKNAKAEAERLKVAFKEDLKNLLAHHTLLGLREFNGRMV